MFETLVDGQYANPVMVVDEIDKAGGEHAYDPLGALYSLLEHDTAGNFTDEFAEVPIDASQVIWVATANDDRAHPRADPQPHERVRGAGARPRRGAPHRRQLYRSIRADHDWGARFERRAARRRARAPERDGAARDAPRLDDGLRQRQARRVATRGRWRTCPTRPASVGRSASCSKRQRSTAARRMQRSTAIIRRMPASLHGQLVVAISSRALFDFEEENRVFEASDDRAYMQLQLQRLERAGQARRGVLAGQQAAGLQRRRSAAARRGGDPVAQRPGVGHARVPLGASTTACRSSAACSRAASRPGATCGR